MKFEVVYSYRAKAKLIRIGRYISKKSSSRIAEAYVQRIRDRCKTLATFPQRGGDLSAVSSGLRFEGFERSATIVFRIRAQRVTIVAVYYRGIDVERKLHAENEA
jgi:toxin ParE1/3/4